MQRALDRYEQDIPPTKIYNINQLEAMRMADLAWREVSQHTIFNCWKKTGNLPDSLLASPSGTSSRRRSSSMSTLTSLPSSHSGHHGPTIMKTTTPPTDDCEDDIADAEQELESAVSQLQATGILRASNALNLRELRELLDMPEEAARMNESTDQEICDAVKEKVAEEQMLEINGGDDFDSAAQVPRPSRRQALEAASTLWAYLSDRDDGFARQLEVVLAQFGCQTRLDDMKTMRDTQMTDYFTRIAAEKQ
ncbi:hypothetical protein B0H10DRAFT_2033776 [Mycena sp. CBHHK59/15]|nr:hypothetical protein B0H10DRAFT_2033776 [Mycena sp. CBHHK59/15]